MPPCPWKNGTSVVPLTATYTYNAAGRRSAVDGPSPKNDVREFTYDLAGRLVTSTYYKGATVGYTTSVDYNDAGERLQVRSELDDAGTEFQVRRWTYTRGGLVETSTELHDGGVAFTTTNTYDAGGRLRTVTDPRPGCVLTTTPDRLGRVLTQTGNASCPGSLAFTYRPDGSIDTATDTVSTITYDLDYDDTGRVEVVNKGTAPETTYLYNDDGQLQSLESAAGTTSYTYVTDHGPYQGMIESVDDPLFSTGVSTYAYDAAGRLSTRTDSQGGAGFTWTRDYEPETSRVASQTIYKGANKLGDFRLTYDEAGNVAVRTERVGENSSDPRNGPTTYTYDAAGRLTSATGPDPSDPAGAVRTWDWTYDGAGNRTSETTDGVTTAWDLDAQGWPLRSDGATPGVTTDDTTYGWDRAGNLTSVDAPGTAGDQSFTLDAFDRITNATLGGVSVGYTLDAFARTITRTQGSVTTTFTYEGISEILARSVTGTTATTYAHTPGGPLGERSGTATPQLYLRDLHSDIVGTVDPTSTTPLSRAYYTPWGEPTWEDGTSALGFQSQYTDPGTGFVDMTTRSYVPELGRFASQDVVFGGLRHPLSLNQWAYAEGDPLTNTDSLGLGVTKDADPPDGCVGTCASDGVEPSEHGNPESGTTTEQRIFEYLVERPVQAYVYFDADPKHTTWQELVALMAGGALDSITGPYCPGGRALCNWVPSEHERAMIQRIQAVASADLIPRMDGLVAIGFCLAGAWEGGLAGGTVGTGVGGVIVPVVGAGPGAVGGAIIGATGGCIAGMNSLGPSPYGR